MNLFNLFAKNTENVDDSFQFIYKTQMQIKHDKQMKYFIFVELLGGIAIIALLMLKMNHDSIQQQRHIEASRFYNASQQTNIEETYKIVNREMAILEEAYQNDVQPTAEQEAPALETNWQAYALLTK